jgi:hypothetical protein
MRSGSLGIETNSKGSLVVHYGCGGCSNDYETTLTIAHRGGVFVVAGFSLGWETREGSGSCDVNLLTGKGFRSRGQAKAKPIRAIFIPVRLADWSAEKQTEVCF